MSQSCITFLLLLNVLYCYGEKQDNYFNYNNMSTFSNDTKSFISFGDQGRYQKCCPSQFFYDASKHTCVTSVETQELYRNPMLKSDPSNCDVILDQVFSNDDLQKLLQTGENGTITYENSKYTLDRYCLDNTENQEFVLKICLESDICDKRDGIVCINKCCPYGEVVLVDESTFGICKPDNESNGFNLMLQSKLQVPDRFGTRWTDIRRHDEIKCIFQPILWNINYTIDNEGVLMKGLTVVGWTINYFLDSSLYCMEVRVVDNNQYNRTPVLHMCYPNQELVEEVKTTHSAYNNTYYLSGVCMVATMGFYWFVYKLEKVIHMIVFSYCLVYVIGMICLCAPLDTTGVMKPYAFWGHHYEEFSKAMWINVMSFDVWNTLRSMKSNMENLTLRNKKKYLWYSLYGWVLPVIMVLFQYEDVYSRYIINVFHLKRKYFTIVFWVMPNTILTMVNLIFFVLTMYHIIKSKCTIRKMTDTVRDLDKKKEIVTLYTSLPLKLFLLMGLQRCFWTFYILYYIGNHHSTVMLNSPPIIKVIDALHGVAIFCSHIVEWSMVKTTFRKIFKIIMCNRC